MANANLPNDYKDVAPGWKPLPFPRTPYLDIFRFTKVPGDGAGRFTCDVPPYYTAQTGRTRCVHGGVSAALSIKAAQIFHQESVDVDASAAKPLTIHIEYLKPLPQGGVHVLVDTLVAGRRQACYRVTLRPGNGSKEAQPCMSATIRLGALADGTSAKTIQEPLGPLPDRHRDCARWVEPKYSVVNPVIMTMRAFTPNDNGHPFWSSKFGGRNVRYHWFKPDDGGTFHMEHLPLLADMVLGIPLNHEKNPARAAFEHLLPTMSMHMTLRADVTGEEWLLCKGVMRKLQDNWFDMDILIINERGQVVATCLQTCAYIPVKKGAKKEGGNSHL